MSPDHGFDWNSVCGIYDGDNFCSRSRSSGFFYLSWLYLRILLLLTSDSIGILSVGYMPVIISVHGVCHLVFFMGLVVFGYFIIPDDGFDRNSFCGLTPVIISGHGVCHLVFYM